MNDMDEIFSVAYLKNATRKSDLIKRLNELHKSLSKLSQDESQLPKELKSIAKQLVSERILNHGDKEIRLVASCCLVDIFRIYAPESPFSDEEMVTVFEVIISQLRSLATNDTTSGIGMKTFYILNSLSTFKSCVLTIILAETGIKGASDLVTSLFDALISSIRSEHNEEISNHMANVLQACIEESSDLDQDVLDILLTPLLPNSKAENPAAYMLVGNVLRRVASVIINPITAFINHILVGAGSSDKGSELADHVYSLIYELHKISPSLLLRVLPNVSMQLQSEDETIRTNAVKLLGRLFASPHADYCTEFHKNFKDFLNRFLDISATIRSEMVENVALIMKRKPSLINQIEEHFVKRLVDADHDIRLLALNKLLEIAAVDLNKFSANTYKEIGGRFIDKKVEVKKTAMQGLAKLYFRNISSVLPPLDTTNSNQDFKELVDRDALERLSFVPSHIVKCWTFPDLKHLTIQLLQENILPKSVMKSDATEKKEDDVDIDGRRACASILMFSLLDAADRSSFGGILSIKRRFQLDLESFLETRAKLSTQDSGLKVSNENSFKRAMFRLSGLLPTSDKKVVDKLHSMKDKTVFKLLSKCILPDDNINEACSNREQLKQRVDSKSVLGQNVEYLYDMAGYLLVNAEMSNHLLEFLTKCEDAIEQALDVAEFVSLLAKSHSTVFTTSSSLLEEWITLLTNSTSSTNKRKSKTINHRLLECCISTINDAGICLGSDKNADSICKVILARAMEHNDAGICEQLAVAASRIALVSSSTSKSAENVMIKAIKQLTSKKHLSLTNDRLACDLSILAGIVRIPPSMSAKVNFSELFSDSIFPTVHQVRKTVMEFITLDLLDNDESDVTTMEAGLKIWTNFISSEEEIAQKSKGPSDEEEEVEDEELTRELNSLLKTIFDCLNSNGSKLGLTEIDDKAKRIHVYETAACCCMNLIKLKSVAETMTIPQWHALAWSLLHGNDETRKNILVTLRTQMLAYPLHPRFLVYPCLLASDELLGSSAKAALKSAISRLRNTHEELCSSALLEDDDKLRQLAEQHIPETVIPFALHLLSYHPDFPESPEATGEADKKRLKLLIKCLNMILDVLTETLRNQAENLSFLIKQVSLISQHYEDRQDPHNIGLQYITKVTYKLLTARVKTGENLQPYPGDINLPIDLYQLKKTTKHVGLENSDLAIEKAVQASSRSKQHDNRHKSPKVKADSSVDVSAKKKESKPKKEKEIKQKKVIQMEIPERASSRQTKKASYIEPEEDEGEVEEWHKNAGTIKKKSTAPKSKRSYEESDDDDEENEENVKENRSFNMDIEKNDNKQQKKAKNFSSSSKQLDLNSFVKVPVKENGSESKKRKGKAPLEDEELEDERPVKAARKPIRG